MLGLPVVLIGEYYFWCEKGKKSKSNCTKMTVISSPVSPDMLVDLARGCLFVCSADQLGHLTEVGGGRLKQDDSL